MIEKNHIAKIVSGGELDARTRIIKAGLEEFAMCSPKAARTREIAARANVNHAAINYYFRGKNELYMEIARHISEYIQDYTSEYYERSKAVYASKSPEDAFNLLVDFITSRICAERENTKIFRCIVLIITREELYQRTKAFDLFFREVFAPSIDLTQRLVEIASRGMYGGLEARIVAEMLMGQVHMFNSARTGTKSINGWSVFGEPEVAEVRRIFMLLARKVLNLSK